MTTTTQPTSSQADSVTMSGDGLYSLATVGAKHVIDAAYPMVKAALDSLNLDHNFTFLDTGCADGGTSLAMVGKLIKAVRQKSADLPIQIVYADQPRNDYNALVKIIHGLTQFDSYHGKHENVFALFSGTSFYQSILPAGSLNLGFSATAMHWLSRKPGNISEHVHAVGASGKELAAFQEQGRRDWETILLNRSKELKPGGKLVLVNFGKDEQGRYLGNTGGINMFDTFNAIWQSFVNDKTITQEEYVNMTLPQYYNTVEEFSAPLLDRNSAVFASGLRLDSIETRVVKCPFAEDYKVHGDAEKFSREYIPTIRTWNESTYFAGLSTERPMQQRKAIIENYYETYKKMAARKPKDHAMDYVHSYMTISKI